MTVHEELLSVLIRKNSALSADQKARVRQRSSYQLADCDQPEWCLIFGERSILKDNLVWNGELVERSSIQDQHLIIVNKPGYENPR